MLAKRFPVVKREAASRLAQGQIPCSVAFWRKRTRKDCPTKIKCKWLMIATQTPLFLLGILVKVER